jgi:hypothetical protein
MPETTETTIREALTQSIGIRPSTASSNPMKKLGNDAQEARSNDHASSRIRWPIMGNTYSQKQRRQRPNAGNERFWSEEPGANSSETIEHSYRDPEAATRSCPWPTTLRLDMNSGWKSGMTGKPLQPTRKLPRFAQTIFSVLKPRDDMPEAKAIPSPPLRTNARGIYGQKPSKDRLSSTAILFFIEMQTPKGMATA